jgi:hypothetical protein
LRREEKILSTHSIILTAPITLTLNSGLLLRALKIPLAAIHEGCAGGGLTLLSLGKEQHWMHAPKTRSGTVRYQKSMGTAVDP